MIYQKQEFVQDDTGDEEFPIKVIDRLQSLDDEDVRFLGRATLNMRTPLGIQQIPISFEIEADDIEDAFEQYTEAATPKVEEVRRRMQEQIDRLRQEQDRRIVTPDQTAGGPGQQIIDFGDLKGGQ